MFSFESGMQRLIDVLATGLGGSLRTGTTVQRIIRETDGGWRVETYAETFHAKAVVISTPSWAAAELVEPFAPEIAGDLKSIEYPPVAVVALGFPRERVRHPLDGFGFLVPEVQRARILGAVFSSSLFPNRAPDGHVLVTTFVGGARQPEEALRPLPEIAASVTGELRDLIGADGAPSFSRVSVWKRAIPQYNIGHTARAARLAEWERTMGSIRFCSNFVGGVSVGDCVVSAKRVVGEMLSDEC
jgi:oxygen-dependent protoporphyrinogen oxidase